MVPTAREIIDTLWSEANSGTLSTSQFLVYDFGTPQPYQLILISQDKTYAAKIYLGRYPESFGFADYGFRDPRNAYFGVDLIDADLYFSAEKILTFNAGNIYKGEDKLGATLLNPLYNKKTPEGVFENLRVNAESDSVGYINTSDARVVLSAAFPEIDDGPGTSSAINGDGAFVEGVTLAAPSVSGDPDGDAANPNYSYQWFGNDSAISGANGSTYKVPVSGAGNYKVSITYSDAQNNRVTLYSPGRVVSSPPPTATPTPTPTPTPPSVEEVIVEAVRSGSRISAQPNQVDEIILAPKSFKTGKPDIIVGFNPQQDSLPLERDSFKRLTSNRLTVVATRNQIKRSNAGINKTKLVYNTKNGKLLFDQNGKKKGFGVGGVIASLERLGDGRFPLLTSSDLPLI